MDGRRDTEKKVVRNMMNDLSAKGTFGGIRSRLPTLTGDGGRWKVESESRQWKVWGEGDDRI